MNIQINLISGTLAVLMAGATPAALAFNSGDVMTFDPGILGCPSGGAPPNCDSGTAPVVVEGSYFAMDFDGSGTLDPIEKTPISPGSDGGIIIGVSQPASGSHAGCPDGSENAGIDTPWCFFGNTGMHQTEVTPVTDNLDGTMNFTGWGVTWNAIPNITLGGDPAHFPADTGLGVLNCATAPCQQGVPYTLDYTAHVPVSDPSGFGGVFYGLHLEVAGPTASVTISVSGGTPQECASTDGNTVSMTGTAAVPDGDSVASLNWTIDGNPAGSGATIVTVLELGTHSVEAELTTTNGLTATDTAAVIVQDTTAPVIHSAFIDPRNGDAITTVSRSGPVEISFHAEDMCDPAPAVAAMVGAPADDMQRLTVAKKAGKVSMEIPSLTLSVTAHDASGNVATEVTTLNIVEE